MSSTSGYTRQIGEILAGIGSFVVGSFFRFMILLGILFHTLGYFWAEDIIAGHLAVYGTTAIVIGVVGWFIVWWKIQDEY